MNSSMPFTLVATFNHAFNLSKSPTYSIPTESSTYFRITKTALHIFCAYFSRYLSNAVQLNYNVTIICRNADNKESLSSIVRFPICPIRNSLSATSPPHGLTIIL